jgi:hypothetical protein
MAARAQARLESVAVPSPGAKHHRVFPRCEIRIRWARAVGCNHKRGCSTCSAQMSAPQPDPLAKGNFDAASLSKHSGSRFCCRSPPPLAVRRFHSTPHSPTTPTCDGPRHFHKCSSVVVTVPLKTCTVGWLDACAVIKAWEKPDAKGPIPGSCFASFWSALLELLLPRNWVPQSLASELGSVRSLAPARTWLGELGKSPMPHLPHRRRRLLNQSGTSGSHLPSNRLLTPPFFAVALLLSSKLSAALD